MTTFNLDKIVELNQQGYTQQQIAEYFGHRHYQNVQDFLKRKGVKLKWIPKRKYSIDETFFETIDCEIKAYLLGFFYADGCIYSNDRIGLSLQAEDVYIINLFRDCISPDSYIRDHIYSNGVKCRKPQKMWRVNSKQLVTSLYKLGLTQRKTLNPLIELPLIDDKFIHHFIRGYFDGDGSVGRREHHSKYHLNRVNFSGTWKKLFEQVKQLLHEQGLKNIRITEKQGVTCKYYSLDIDSNIDSDLFFDYIYKDANFFLERKYKKFYKHNTEVTAKSKDLATP